MGFCLTRCGHSTFGLSYKGDPTSSNATVGIVFIVLDTYKPLKLCIAVGVNIVHRQIDEMALDRRPQSGTREHLGVL